jgi:hypothetical protein
MSSRVTGSWSGGSRPPEPPSNSYGARGVSGDASATMPPPPDATAVLNHILLTLSSIDDRLSRVEAALSLPLPGPGDPSSLSWASDPSAGVLPPPQPTLAPPPPAPPPEAHHQQQQHQQQQAPPQQQQQQQPPPPAQQRQQQQQQRPLYPTPKALEGPPEGFTISSREQMQAELDAWTVPRGYSMRINGTRTHGSRRKIRLVCFRGGRNRPSRREPVPAEVIAAARAAGRRKPTTDRASKKCDCPFRFELVEVEPGTDRYTVHYANDANAVHNHAPGDVIQDPRARKLPPQVLMEVDAWLRDGTSVGRIQDELRRRGYHHVLDFDLRNRKRALLKKETNALLTGAELADIGVVDDLVSGFGDEDADGIDDVVGD